MFQRLKIQESVDYRYLLCNTKLRLKSKSKISKNQWQVYDNKLSNSISRAKSTIFSIANYNKFGYFYTQTIDSKYDRGDLNALVRRFSQITRDLRKIYDQDFFYLIIPELHKDNKSWHLHGLVSSSYGLDSYINQNGFISLKHFDKIGFNSISKIKNYTACIKYMTEYITKDLAKDRKKGERLFYCSHNLKKCNVIDDLIFTQIPPIHFDFKNEFCFKSDIDQNKYYNFITTIDEDPRVIYYKNNLKNI